MSLIQQQYESQMDDLTPKERIARSIAMLNWTRELIARQILSGRGPRDIERLKWEVAMQQYGSDPLPRKLIQGMLERVSN